MIMVMLMRLLILPLQIWLYDNTIKHSNVELFRTILVFQTIRTEWVRPYSPFLSISRSDQMLLTLSNIPVVQRKGEHNIYCLVLLFRMTSFEVRLVCLAFCSVFCVLK